MSIYDTIGVRTIINAKGTSTRVSGALLAPEVTAAMQEAAQYCIDMAEIQAAASKIIAEVTGAEAAEHECAISLTRLVLPSLFYPFWPCLTLWLFLLQPVGQLLVAVILALPGDRISVVPLQGFDDFVGIFAEPVSQDGQARRSSWDTGSAMMRQSMRPREQGAHANARRRRIPTDNVS